MAIPLFKWLLVLSSLLAGPAGNRASETMRSEKAGIIAVSGDPVNVKNDRTAEATAMHPVYISITEVNHNAVEKTLELSCKMFTDDFEKAILNNYKQKIDLTRPADKAAADKLVADYIQKRLQLKLDGKGVALYFVGFEQERDAVWSYFEIRNVNSAPKRIDAYDALLYDTYEGQINLIHITVSGSRKSFRVSNPEANAVFQF